MPATQETTWCCTFKNENCIFKLHFCHPQHLYLIGRSKILFPQTFLDVVNPLLDLFLHTSGPNVRNCKERRKILRPLPIRNCNLISKSRRRQRRYPIAFFRPLRLELLANVFLPFLLGLILSMAHKPQV